MKALKYIALAALLAGAAGCDDDDDDKKPVVTLDGGTQGQIDGSAAKTDGPDAAATPTPDAGAPDSGPAAIKLFDWVNDLVANHTNATSASDTVDDKNIIDTSDPAAFDSLLQ
jgi:hypothetical protein